MKIATLGLCTNVTLRKFADTHKIPLENVSIDLSYQHENDQDLIDLKIEMKGELLTENDKLKLISAAKACPIHKLMVGGKSIRIFEK